MKRIVACNEICLEGKFYKKNKSYLFHSEVGKFSVDDLLSAHLLHKVLGMKIVCKEWICHRKGN